MNLDLSTEDRDFREEVRAFVAAHLRWRTVSKYDDPVGWVRRVAINKLRDVHRSDTRKILSLIDFV